MENQNNNNTNNVAVVSKVGVTGWATKQRANKGNFEREELPRLKFMKIKEGRNLVRILAVGVYYQARLVLPKSKAKYGDRIRTAAPTYPDCPIVNDLGKQARERYYMIVINRADSEIQIADVNEGVYDQVVAALEEKNLAREPEDKEVTIRDFDINIKRDSKAPPANFYMALANDKKPLSAKDIALIDALGDETMDKILNRQCICPKPETVKKRLMDLGWIPGQPLEEAKAESADLEKPTEDDFNFKKE